MANVKGRIHQICIPRYFSSDSLPCYVSTTFYSRSRPGQSPSPRRSLLPNCPVFHAWWSWLTSPLSLAVGVNQGCVSGVLVPEHVTVVEVGVDGGEGVGAARQSWSCPGSPRAPAPVKPGLLGVHEHLRTDTVVVPKRRPFWRQVERISSSSCPNLFLFSTWASHGRNVFSHTRSRCGGPSNRPPGSLVSCHVIFRSHRQKSKCLMLS